MKVEHVFVLMLENHSFDNMFAMSGIPNIIRATNVNSNVWNKTIYNVRTGAPVSMPTDPGHEFSDTLEQLAGVGASYQPWNYPTINNNGFAANYATTTTEGPTPPAADVGDIMACFDTANQLPVLYYLAKNYALCDQWFSSMPGPTWPNRFFVHGASSNGLDHMPTEAELALWNSVDGFSYPNGSIFDLLNANNISWRLYQDQNGPYEGAFAQVATISGIWLWSVNDLAQLSSDLHGGYPYAYTFIEPNYGDVVDETYEKGSSQHPMDGVWGGENLILNVYAAIRNSPVWDTSLLIITYDEHGGFYDHVAPSKTNPPDDHSSSWYNDSGFTFDVAGVRVPTVVVSPWIPAGTVDHTVYDHSSVLKTVENLFGNPTPLAPLTQRDANANDLLHLLSLTSARSDCPPPPLPAPLPPVAAVRTMTPERRAALDLEPLPRSGNLAGFLSVAHKAELELAGRNLKLRAATTEQFKSIRTRGQARAYMQLVKQKLAAARPSRR